VDIFRVGFFLYAFFNLNAPHLEESSLLARMRMFGPGGDGLVDFCNKLTPVVLT
jgi:hypothetical protein